MPQLWRRRSHKLSRLEVQTLWEGRAIQGDIKMDIVAHIGMAILTGNLIVSIFTNVDTIDKLSIRIVVGLFGIGCILIGMGAG